MPLETPPKIDDDFAEGFTAPGSEGRFRQQHIPFSVR